MISRTAEQVFIPLTVGGGVRERRRRNALLRAGADKVSINSAAVRDPSLLAPLRRPVRHAVHGRRDRCDARADGDGWEVVVDAGRTPTGRDAVEWAVEATAEHGAGEVLLTSMDRDGTGEGYDLELLRAVGGAVNVPVVASGGAGRPGSLRGGARRGRSRRRARRERVSTSRSSRSARSRTTWLERGIPVTDR